MSNSKTVTIQENKKNLEKKLGEILGLERAAQKAVDELISMKLIKSNSKDEAKEIQKEATSHEDQIQEVVLELSEDKDIKLDVHEVEQTAEETEQKVTQINENIFRRRTRYIRGTRIFVFSRRRRSDSL